MATANIDIVNGVVGRVAGGYAYCERLANGWVRVIVIGGTGGQEAYQPQIVMAPSDQDFGVWPTYPAAAAPCSSGALSRKQATGLTPITPRPTSRPTAHLRHVRKM